MRHAYVWIGVLTIVALCSIGVTAQEPAADTSNQGITIPRLIKFSGTLKDSAGRPRMGMAGITFALYASQEGGEPLWRENQTVETDEQGRYGVYLGESEKEGLPLELFSAEKARWLGVQVQGEEEQPRILFASVPYALKAKDADTVGGRPLSSFVLYEDLEKLAADSETTQIKTTGSTSRTAAAGKNGKQASIVMNNVAVSNSALFNAIGGGGTANAIAKFTDADNIGASALTEVGGNIGVGTSTPYAKFTFVYDSSAVDPVAMLDTNVASPRSWRFGGGVGTPGTFTIRDDTAGANRFSISQDGNIGVGTSTPYAKFTFVYDSSVVDPIAMLDTNAAAARSWRFGGGVGAAGTFTIRDDTAGANRFSIDSAGNVGIGTTSPTAKLTVAGDIESSTGFKINGNSVFSISGNNNTFVGVSAGSNNTGQWNSFFGYASGSANTTGQGNSFFGQNAGMSNTTGGANSFFGMGAGLFNTTGSLNSFFGWGSGLSNTTGSDNSFLGRHAGFSNTTGSFNSFFGSEAGYSNTTASNNSFFGRNAGHFNTTGTWNSFFGQSAGINNTTGSWNSFFGQATGSYNTTGNSNAFFGQTAGWFNTTGNSNSFFGQGAGSANTTASNNSFFGQHAGGNNTTGDNNSFFGQGAGTANATANNNSFFGQNAGNINNGDYNSFFGMSAGQVNTTASYNSFYGAGAGLSNTTGDANNFFGAGAGYYNTTGDSNNFFGLAAGMYNTTGRHNDFFGDQSGTSNTTGNANSFFGGAGYHNTIGSDNSFLGRNAGRENTEGNNNSFLGSHAGHSNVSGSLNTAVGYHAGYNSTGSNNVYLSNEGEAGDSNIIRIGVVTPTTEYPNAHTQTFIAGIANATVSGSVVIVNSNGQLGIATSSRRFKEDIQDMGEASSDLLRLRPVTFHYKPEYSKSATGLQYGLIAEEVAEVYPDLVQYDKDGKPFTVQYQVLSSMLLNEIQKQHAAIGQKDFEIANLRRQILAMREAESASDARLTAIERTLELLTMQTTENRGGK